jgi:hypothetical protein
VRQRIAERPGHVKPRTLNGQPRAPKALANALLSEEYPLGFDPRKLKPIKREKRLPPDLAPEQPACHLGQPDREAWSGQRDHCLRSLLADTDIRVSECLTLRLGDVNPSEGTISVVGKGKKQRRLALCLGMQRTIRRWLKAREGLTRTHKWESDCLFPSRCGDRLSYRTVAERIQDYGQDAGIEGVGVGPHSSRSTYTPAPGRSIARSLLPGEGPQTRDRPSSELGRRQPPPCRANKPTRGTAALDESSSDLLGQQPIMAMRRSSCRLPPRRDHRDNIRTGHEFSTPSTSPSPPPRPASPRTAL